MVTVINNYLTEVTQSSLTGVLECNASTPRSHSRENGNLRLVGNAGSCHRH
jgi:hypothetical protein